MAFSNSEILALLLGSDAAFDRMMTGAPVPVTASPGGWERVWRNCEEILDLDAPKNDCPQPSEQWHRDLDAESDDVPF